MQDRELLALLRENPSEGLREIMRAWGGLLYTVAARILPGSPQDVEECVSDTLVNLWRSLDRLDGDVSVKGYLLCIARNTAINRYHKLKRGNCVSLSVIDVPGGEDFTLRVLSDAESRQLQELVAALPEPGREMVIRKYFLFESYKEIAAGLDMSADNVKKQLYRSRQKLRTALEERGISVEAI